MQAYVQEYAKAEKDLVANKRAARAVGDFFVPDEAKLALVIRIRGINGVSPKVKKILQILRLRQVRLRGGRLQRQLRRSSSAARARARARAATRIFLPACPSRRADLQRDVCAHQQGDAADADAGAAVRGVGLPEP